MEKASRRKKVEACDYSDYYVAMKSARKKNNMTRQLMGRDVMDDDR